MSDALTARGVSHRNDDAGSGLDFVLDGVNVYIECKQFHTPRIAEQTSRVENVIVIQGKAAAEMFAAMLSQH